jgi:hypothetical protein
MWDAVLPLPRKPCDGNRAPGKQQRRSGWAWPASERRTDMMTHVWLPVLILVVLVVKVKVRSKT